MASKCLNCGHVIPFIHEIQATAHKTASDVVGWVKTLGDAVGPLFGAGSAGAFSGHLNSGKNAYRCPKCKTVGQWEDV